MIKIYPPNISEMTVISFLVIIDNKYRIFVLNELDEWSDNDANGAISKQVKEFIYELIGLVYTD